MKFGYIFQWMGFCPLSHLKILCYINNLKCLQSCQKLLFNLLEISFWAYPYKVLWKHLVVFVVYRLKNEPVNQLPLAQWLVQKAVTVLSSSFTVLFIFLFKVAFEFHVYTVISSVHLSVCSYIYAIILKIATGRSQNCFFHSPSIFLFEHTYTTCIAFFLSVYTLQFSILHTCIW